MSPAPTHLRRQQQAATNTRINLGPLTTTFAQPAHCTRNALVCPTCTGAIRGQTCSVVGGTATAEDDTGCWPRATNYPNGGVANPPLLGMGFYSPGVICPAGHTSACTAISATNGQKTTAPKVTGQFQFPLAAGETAIGCCPTGYACAINGGVQTCHQEATSTSFDAMTCNGVTEGDLNAFKVPFTNGAATVSTMHLYAPMIQINHKATDLPSDQVAAAAEETSVAAASSSSATSGLLTMTGLSSSIPATTTPTPDLPSSLAQHKENAQEDNRLATGTKIGIACAPLAVAALICVILFYRRWKKNYLYPEDYLKDKSISPNPSDPNQFPQNPEAAMVGSRSPGTTPPQHGSPFPTYNESPYNADHNPQDFAMGGPGPVVAAAGGYGRADKMADIDDDAWDHNYTQTHTSPRLGHGPGEHGERGMESPIDGTSPFRLKRGNTLGRTSRRLTVDDSTMGPAAARRMSPLVRSNTVSSNHSSQDAIQWEMAQTNGLRRADSFSRPRRPRTRTNGSSQYNGGRSRASSVWSWNEKGAEPLVTNQALGRTQSFSRPRPRRDESADTLVEGNSTIPRVTREGVAF